ncbi:hypothetical protein Xen7305DRAFT_00016110 [Xenococcus sp. PCC 7305]|uniref:hypothetical protein n=1 Tax=Xenococcus sp. PCC 7305 TaxID=102125 RepID=UPI0002ACE645|nr:hypothetical protein [Xenococcus sp. PCC 7305]ELS01904.1 hypothetical protein Xen7305DRAFT_00016110 [Xenococcus sp. PCC 7305]
MNSPKIEIDIAEILKDIQSKQYRMFMDMQSKQDRMSIDMQSKQDKILEEIKEIKVGQAKLEGRIDTLDEKLSGQIKTLDAKVEQIDKRVANQEFANRGVLVGLIVALLVGTAKVFGFGGNI